MPYKYKERVLVCDGMTVACFVSQLWKDVQQDQLYQLTSISYFHVSYDAFDDLEVLIETKMSEYQTSDGKPALKVGKMPDDHGEIHARIGRLMGLKAEETDNDNHNHMVARRDLTREELQRLKLQLQTLGFSAPSVQKPTIVGQIQSN